MAAMGIPFTCRVMSILCMEDGLSLAEPVIRNADYMFADNHFVFRFTSEMVANDIGNVNE